MSLISVGRENAWVRPKNPREIFCKRVGGWSRESGRVKGWTRGKWEGERGRFFAREWEGERVNYRD